jgi:hypothetical protein
MKKRPVLSLLILATLSIVLMKSSVWACSCAYSSPCQEFGKAKMIFVGKMMEGSEKLWAGKDKTGKQVSYEAGQVRFAVEEVFKGDKVSEVMLQVSSNKDTSCGYSMTRGEKYLVYAYEYKGRLSTGVCTRTSIISNDHQKEDFEFLRNPPAPGSGGKLNGSIWSSEGGGKVKPMAEVKVAVISEDQHILETKTSQEGEFQLAGLKPGKYRVEPVWPAHYASYYPTPEVEVFDQGCSSVGFQAEIDGRVSGRILDAKGRPTSVTIYLEPVNPKSFLDSKLDISGNDGNFEIRGIPPGQYLLYFELEASRLNREKKYFYPGTWNRSNATAIDLTIGQRIGGYEFQTPPEFTVQTVEGKVTWPDGAPAAGVEVLLLCPRNPRPGGYVLELGAVQTRTDEDGSFTIQGFKGNSYWLEARGRKSTLDGDQGIESHSASRRLVLQKDLSGQTLVLSLPGFFGKGCQ